MGSYSNGGGGLCMRFFKRLVPFILIAVSSAFFVGAATTEKAEALCPKIGQYHNHGADGTQQPNGPCTSALNDADTKSAKGLVDYINMIVYPLAGIGISLSVVAIVYGGYLYMTSGIDSKNLERAKLILISAGIGIFITMSMFVIAKMFASLAGFV